MNKYARVISMNKKGISFSKIAKLEGLKVATIKDILKRNGVYSWQK